MYLCQSCFCSNALTHCSRYGSNAIDECWLLPAAVSTSHSLQDAPQNGSKLLMMRHGKRVARLGRPADQRKALVRNLTTDVLKYGRIMTTQVCSRYDSAQSTLVGNSAHITVVSRAARVEVVLAVLQLLPPLATSFGSCNDAGAEKVVSLLQVKAKAIRKYVDKMITLAKRNTLHARRQVRHTPHMSRHMTGTLENMLQTWFVRGLDLQLWRHGSETNFILHSR